MDAKSTFLSSVLKQEVYIEQPTGFVRKDQEDKVYMLKRTLYGLKQVWCTIIDSYFITRGFQRYPYKYILDIKSFAHSNVLIVCLYVDDLIFIRNNSEMIVEFREAT